jgi:hypothetical protein
MASPFRFKLPLPSEQHQSTPTPKTQLAARNFLLPRRTPSTPSSSSITSESLPFTADIADAVSDDDEFPRKRPRKSSTEELSSDGYSDPSEIRKVTEYRTRPPPVLLPSQTIESPPIDFSPSRSRKFLPNGLAAYTAQIIQEYEALSSVAVPRIDKEEIVKVDDSHSLDGEIGWICSIRSDQADVVVVFLSRKGSQESRGVGKGDSISISNPIKLDGVWFCAKWQVV